MLLVASLVLGACTPASPDVEEKWEVYYSCSGETVEVSFNDLDGNELKKLTLSGIESVVYKLGSTSYQIREGFSDESQPLVDAFENEVNALIAELNEEMGLIYPTQSFFYEVDISEVVYNNRYYDECSEEPHLKTIYFSDWNKAYHEYFTIGSNTVGSNIYVEVKTPSESRVEYVYPSKWIDEIFYSVLVAESELFDFDPKFVTPESEFDEQVYGEEILQTLISNGWSGEVIYFSVESSDFEGRTELRKAIATAMNVAAVAADRPVTMTLKGMMSSGQQSVAQVSAHQNDINIHGWQALTFGSISGSGGGGSLQADYSSSFVNVLEGSIFILNP